MPSDKWSARVSQVPREKQNKSEGHYKSGYVIALEDMCQSGYVDAGPEYLWRLTGTDNARILDLTRVAGAYYEAKKILEGESEFSASDKQKAAHAEMKSRGAEMKSLKEKWEKEDEK